MNKKQSKRLVQIACGVMAVLTILPIIINVISMI